MTAAAVSVLLLKTAALGAAFLVACLGVGALIGAIAGRRHQLRR